MSTTTITVSTQAGVAEWALRAVTGCLKSCLTTFLEWRQMRLDMAELRSLSDVELKDIGIDRGNIEPPARMSLRNYPWVHVDII